MKKDIIHLFDENFENEILKFKLPILVDFWSNSCGPCIKLLSILDEICEEYRKKLIIGKVDVDKNYKISSIYNIRSVPTILIFKKNKIIDKHIGLLSKDKLINFINKNI